MPAFDYTPEVARLYDEYCLYTHDIPFFQRLLRGSPGPVLELMAGTGRVSLPLASLGLDLTCLDSSLPMLSVLRQKLGSPRCVAGSVTRVPFAARRFQDAILPFNGLSELATTGERAALFHEVHRVLRPGGRFVCTGHNPTVRLRAVCDEWQVLGVVPRSAGGSLRLSLRGAWQPATGLVVGQQRIESLAPDGATTADLLLNLRFSLPGLEEVIAMAEAAGFRLKARYGDYAESPYDVETSPFIIAVFVSAP